MPRWSDTIQIGNLRVEDFGMMHIAIIAMILHEGSDVQAQYCKMRAQRKSEMEARCFGVGFRIGSSRHVIMYD